MKRFFRYATKCLRFVTRPTAWPDGEFSHCVVIIFVPLRPKWLGPIFGKVTVGRVSFNPYDTKDFFRYAMTLKVVPVMVSC